MQQSTIAIIILIVAVILYVIDRIPMCVVALMSMLAMVFFGIISWSDAFAGMGNSTVMLIMGMSVVGGALIRTGFARTLGNALIRVSKSTSEKTFIFILYIVGCVTSAAFHAVAVMCIFLPVIDALIANSDGKYTRKQTYMALGVGSLLGSNLTIAGSGSMLLSVSLLSDSEFGYQMGFFEPALIGCAGVLIGIIFYLTVGHSWYQKTLKFEDSDAAISLTEDTKSDDAQSPWKKWFVLGILAVGIVCMIRGANVGGVAMTLATICMLTGCITPKDAFDSVGWPSLFLIVGALGFAKGLDVSGAGQVIADTVIGLFGPLGENAFVMCSIICCIAAVLSEFMSNNGTVAICVPIGLLLAKQLGASPVAFTMAAAITIILNSA